MPGSKGSGAWFKQARLWMPWQHGEPVLHTLEVVGAEGTVLHSQRFGLRCAAIYYEARTNGPAFRINGQRLFLAGANWITTDQFLRFAGNSQRYDDEVRLMRRAGSNLIRVWGGGLAERPEFFEACDRLGMLVYQEFWMTGDNNGPQAGSYSWPLDHSVYIDNARDTILLLRGHPSLFWWGGGNELYPSDLCPPPDINRAIRDMVDELDGSRPYVQTSSLLQQMKTYNPRDVLAALAVNDGPYGAQAPREFFLRNPQLHYTLYPNRTGVEPFPLSINPEVGGPNWPTYSGLKKFITSERAPSRKGSEVAEEFDYHVFEAFNIDMTVNRPNWTSSYSHTTVDPVYDLWGDNPITTSLERYSWRANLVQYAQHRLLFEGYLQNQWSWYAGVILWKGQAPWPSLRGFVYDWYLEPGAARLYRVHRGWATGPEAEARVQMYSLPGGEFALSRRCRSPAIEPHAVVELDCELPWPSSEGAFLLRLTLLDKATGRVIEGVENLLSDPCSGGALVPGMDYRNLDEAPVELQLDHPDDVRSTDASGEHVVVVSNHGKRAALLVHLRLFEQGSGKEILPVWWDQDYFNLLPGEERRVSWEGPIGVVVATGFNVGGGRTPSLSPEDALRV
eukprot:CAMPEP_0177298634 /NCGR_PEP_ID=MMETSP0368-20130122/3606_1 /TAXON_ID=447022 ORGANISM="Scrippsiella hangoei-like, Strain SHHI-4" /NCGR_SAMPLE_ID=MMETSP0368 /ASSEMBLY_ACC=CAM_ASM_000363 /LENGTH=619 /DNA_ID=CAMNT_0018756931 /DNA_START=29 /DNA_END=1888 /DNA_ORIENTATION=+